MGSSLMSQKKEEAGLGKKNQGTLNGGREKRVLKKQSHSKGDCSTAHTLEKATGQKKGIEKGFQGGGKKKTNY